MPKSLQQKWQDLVASKDGPGGSSASSERLVALTLSLHMKPDGSAFPGQLLLMERTALCERTVRVALDTLERDEWITRKKPGRNYIYQARIPARLTPATAAGIDDRIPATAAAVENPTPATDSTTPATGSKNTGNDCPLTDQEHTNNKESDTPVYPIGLNIAAWTLYMEHRKELKKPITSRGRQMAMTKLARYPPDVQMQSVEESIAQGYTGVFPEKVKDHATNRQRESAAGYARRVNEEAIRRKAGN